MTLQATKRDIQKGLYQKPSPTSSKATMPVIVMPKNESSKKWSDFVYRYYWDDDTLKLFFERAVPGLITESETFQPGLVVDYDKEGRIVAVEICRASKVLACDLVDTSYIISGGKMPMQLCPYYKPESNVFEVFFLAPENSMLSEEIVVEETKMYLLLNSKKEIVGIKFMDASETICKV